MPQPFADFYRGRTVLVTGHTGFKGSWLALWLTELGANVVGYGLEPPTEPSHFAACRLAKRVCHVQGDVRDFERLARTFAEHQPTVAFHLAAQPLVRRSLSERRLTFDVNVMGTVNVLDAAREAGSVRAAVIVTSDKCYRHRELSSGYREDDELGGGRDPYSVSKACAELVSRLYRDPRFRAAVPAATDLAIASVRSGNVVGGGDWAEDRIVPDVIRALVNADNVYLRNPEAIRPWQHVLEPLSGYLCLAALMTKNADRFNTAWNFGPDDHAAVTVAELVGRVFECWPAHQDRLLLRPDHTAVEAGTLRLDCTKAKDELGWRAVWDLDRTIATTVAWYRRFYSASDDDLYEFSVGQIEDYTISAQAAAVAWAGHQMSGGGTI